jgi:hypothetical protein
VVSSLEAESSETNESTSRASTVAVNEATVDVHGSGDAVVVSAVPADGTVIELQKLADMRTEGLLDEDEFKVAKQRLLGI